MMDVVRKAVNVCAIEIIIMVATDENLMPVWQIAKPVEEIQGFLFGANHAEIAGMDYYVGLGQVPKAMMTIVGVGKV